MKYLIISLCLIYLINCKVPSIILATKPAKKLSTSTFIGKITARENENLHWSNENRTENETDFNPQDYLSQFGYTKEINSSNSTFVSIKNRNLDKDIQEMIMLFQKFFGLNTTGILDRETRLTMKAPRCGVPDFTSKGKLSAFKTTSKWEKTNLTWRLKRFTPDIGEDGTRDAARRAFNYWSEVTNLKFKEVCKKCKSDFIIDFDHGYHHTMCDAFPFDGEGGVLAHAFFPPNGRIHLDEAELFTEGQFYGTNLRIVLTHEIGHALGLDHSDTNGSIMYPIFRYKENFQLHIDDIIGIQTLYGKPIFQSSTKMSTTTTTTTTESTKIKKGSKTKSEKKKNPKGPKSNQNKTTTAQTTTTEEPDEIEEPVETEELETTTPHLKYLAPCVEINKAVFLGPDGSIYTIINNDVLWKYEFADNSWTRDDLLELYPGIESNIRGGAQCNKNYTWFFKSKYVWSYDGRRLRDGFPQYIYHDLFPRNPYTAINKNGIFYIIKGFYAYEFDTNLLTLIGNPQLISKIFPGIPNFIEASIKLDDHHYIFKAEQVFKFDETLNQVVDTYPKDRNEGWFPCESYSIHAPGLYMNATSYMNANTETKEQENERESEDEN